MAREQRRLAAIAAADVVGYSRLMNRDESGAVARLRRNRAEAAAGGIVISRTVHEAVAGRLNASFDDLGELAPKSIERRIRAFGVMWQAEDWRAPHGYAGDFPKAVRLRRWARGLPYSRQEDLEALMETLRMGGFPTEAVTASISTLCSPPGFSPHHHGVVQRLGVLDARRIEEA